MKLTGEIIEVSSNGDSLTVSLQAKVGRASWKEIGRQTFKIDCTAQNRKAFYLGRQIEITLRPK